MSVNQYETPNTSYWGMKLGNYLLVLHLSQYLAFIIPLFGIAAPIIMWATNKDRHPLIDKHGKVIMNWFLSSLIYYFISAFMALFAIGIPFLIILGLMSLLLPIIGAIQAKELKEKVWKYPFSIEFLSIQNS